MKYGDCIIKDNKFYIGDKVKYNDKVCQIVDIAESAGGAIWYEVQWACQCVAIVVESELEMYEE